jgi:uncharacterized membrane protein
VIIQIKVRDIAAASAEGGLPLPPAYDRHMRTWFILGWPAFFSVIAVYCLMVAKPALW